MSSFVDQEDKFIHSISVRRVRVRLTVGVMLLAQAVVTTLYVVGSLKLGSLPAWLLHVTGLGIVLGAGFTTIVSNSLRRQWCEEAIRRDEVSPSVLDYI